MAITGHATPYPVVGGYQPKVAPATPMVGVANPEREMTEFTIEDDVPLPNIASGKYPFYIMATGQSINIEGIVKFIAARSAAHSYGRKNSKKFSTQRDGDGGRIWRIE